MRRLVRFLSPLLAAVQVSDGIRSFDLPVTPTV